MRHHLLPLALALSLVACGEGEPLTPPSALLPDGGRYRGEVVDGLLQGQGRLDYGDGSWFEGRFKDGLFDGQGEWRGVDGVRYVGEFHQGRFDGQGTLLFGDGARYQGGLRQGRMHGEGELEQNGLRYRGGFRDDLFDGLGKLEQADGSSFQGRFKGGQPNGPGVRVDAKGNQFSGTFRDGRLQGAGTYQGKDGSHYSGEFRDDEFSGKGRYQRASGDAWSGRFKAGRLGGAGEFQGADGRHYQGEFRNWRFHGQGRLRHADGSLYEGRFAAGRMHGEGRLTGADGNVLAGTWRNGLRVRDEHGVDLPDPLEVALLRQGELLERELAGLPQSSAEAELYALTLAGDGSTSVFLREADYVAGLLRERFAAVGQAVLVNHRDHLAERPLATRSNLARAIQVLAERSGPEDLVFIYLTSHGSQDHQLQLKQPRLELTDLAADELARLLRPLQARNKVVVISACFSGGFIPALKDERTLVITAARADRVSFGCSEENDFTYFGRALFADALNETDDLERAFARASELVAEREASEGFEPSEPQMWAPRGVLEHWRTLREARARQAIGELAAEAR